MNGWGSTPLPPGPRRPRAIGFFLFDDLAILFACIGGTIYAGASSVLTLVGGSAFAASVMTSAGVAAAISTLSTTLVAAGIAAAQQAVEGVYNAVKSEIEKALGNVNDPWSLAARYKRGDAEVVNQVEDLSRAISDRAAAWQKYLAGAGDRPYWIVDRAPLRLPPVTGSRTVADNMEALVFHLIPRETLDEILVIPSMFVGREAALRAFFTSENIARIFTKPPEEEFWSGAAEGLGGDGQAWGILRDVLANAPRDVRAFLPGLDYVQERAGLSEAQKRALLVTRLLDQERAAAAQLARTGGGRMMEAAPMARPTAAGLLRSADRSELLTAARMTRDPAPDAAPSPAPPAAPPPAPVPSVAPGDGDAGGAPPPPRIVRGALPVADPGASATGTVVAGGVGLALLAALFFLRAV